jgi:signal transduction histidine kinase
VEGVSVEATIRRDAGLRGAARHLDRYAAAFRDYLETPGEAGLARANEIGREALDEGLGVLVMSSVQSEILKAALAAARTEEERVRVSRLAERFAMEALSPFEMAYRGYWEANAALHRLNELLEGQARRIAAALHDEAGQILAGAHFSLAELARTAPEQAGKVGEVRTLLTEAEDRLRNLAHELRPPALNNHGLVPALRFLAESTSKRWGLAVSVRGALDRTLPATVETTLYRIAQEALTNAAKHARASSVNVTVRRTAASVVCSVSDNGVGFASMNGAGSEMSNGLGLLQIKEQVAALGGVLRVGPNRPQGAELTVEIPLDRSRRR